ncbi:hypothetical protein B4U80_07887 [Leptotrombidium deliense]|uniref:Ubiquitin-like protease family profile domain-containing protein n=1 Tax=Leptotrombidium deliense TaxID=299467 RepID=A0A443S0V0_9ACAR|nr:hypothetical protein B4U80_07887 [Leptotrombidium deliense]
MKTEEIHRALKNVEHYAGVHPRNHLPEAQRNITFVANTDTCLEKGTHWVAIYVKNNTAEYFDSFGLPPLTKDFVSFLNNYALWSYNTVTIQDVDSKKCGDFCIAFVKQRSKGVKYSNFIKSFSDGTRIILYKQAHTRLTLIRQLAIID